MCPACPRVFDHRQNKDEHLEICEFYKEYKITGKIPTGVYPRKEVVLTGIWRGGYKSLLSDINRIAYMKLNAKDISHEYLVVFDAECCLMRRGQVFNAFPQDTRTYSYVNNHQLYCGGVASNIPRYQEPEIFMRSHEESSAFVLEMVAYLLKLADESYELMKSKLKPVFDHFKLLYRHYVSTRNMKWARMISKLGKRLEKHCKQLIVGGYNIFRYDIVLLKRAGFLDILNHFDNPVSILKRTKGTYLTVATKRLKFIDQMNYSGKTSLRQLLKEYGIGDDSQKSMFPYSKVTQLNDLNQPLPKYEDFYDELHGCNSLDYELMVFSEKILSGQSREDVLKELGYSEPPKTGMEMYETLLKSWIDNGCETLRDVAIFYLKRDLLPLRDYMLKQRELFFEDGVDVYPNFLSMSHFSFNYAHQFIKDPLVHFFTHIPLVQRQKLQESLCGGISMVFRRLVEPGMQIRPNEMKNGEMVTGIKGDDASNLYGWAFAYPQYFGFFTLRQAHDEFMPQYKGERFSESIQWLHYCAQVEYKTEIRTQWTPGGEQYVHIPLDEDGNVDEGIDTDDDDELESDEDEEPKAKRYKLFRLDGYFVEATTRESNALEYLGEYYHGYCLDHATQENDNEVLAGGKTSKQLRESTFKRLRMIKSQVTNLVVIYDCQWKHMKATVPEVRSFVNSFTFGPQIKKKRLNQQEVKDQILDGDITGFAMVDMTTPLELRNPKHLADIPPIFKNMLVSRENIAGYGKEYAEKHDLLKTPTRMLMASYFCEKLYMSTDYIRFLDDLGVRLDYVHEIMQYDQAPMFRPFICQTTDQRVQADLNGMKHLAKQKKDEINSSYGSCLMNASKMINCKLVDEKQLMRAVSGPLFLDAQACGFTDPCSLWELHTRKRRILHRNLLTIGFQILQVSKMRILDCYYNHMKRFIPDECFQLINMDTDSLYYCHSRETLRDCVPKKLLKQYDESRTKWYATDDPYGKRCPGKMHSEFEGTHMVALGVKLYTCRNDRTGKEKRAHRGISDKHKDNWKILQYKQFRDVLFDQSELPETTMTGFADKTGQMATYISHRTNLHGGYYKRYIEQDLISTKPFEHL